MYRLCSYCASGQRVTVSVAVPTIWGFLLSYLKADPSRRLSHLKRVIIGGSAVNAALIQGFENAYGVDVVHAWGMTELSPVGTFCSEKVE